MIKCKAERNQKQAANNTECELPARRLILLGSHVPKYAMLVVISPAKRLSFDTPGKARNHSQPEFLDDAQMLVTKLRRYSAPRLSKLMSISPALAALNRDRFKQWQPPFTKTNAKAAIEAFAGDVYIGLNAADFSARDLTWAQKNLRILSGLYGVLRPLDLIQPHRLEMGTQLRTPRGKTLYQYWGEEVTDTLNATFATHKQKVLVNLASNEYFGVIKPNQLDARILNVTFKDLKNGKYKVISFFAKKARGLMAAFIVHNRITQSAKLSSFNCDGYAFAAEQSSPEELVFLRANPPYKGQQST